MSKEIQSLINQQNKDSAIFKAYKERNYTRAIVPGEEVLVSVGTGVLGVAAILATVPEAREAVFNDIAGVAYDLKEGYTGTKKAIKSFITKSGKPPASNA